MATDIRFLSFPRTEAPPSFIPAVINAFTLKEAQIATKALKKGLISNEVLLILKPQLELIGFAVEGGKTKLGKIERPVFYGENGKPILSYQIDAYHTEWRCGLEVEAGRAWKGNAVYRDLIQAMVMVQVDHLCLGVPNSYKYQSGAKDMISTDYENTVAVADALFGHTRLKVPYGLTVIGY